MPNSKKGRAGSREDHVFDPGFQRALVEEGVGHQAIDRYREQFQADKQASQVLSADQYDTAGGSQQNQQVELFTVARKARAAVAFTTQVGVRQGDAGQRRGEDQADVEAGIAVDLQQAGDGQRRDLEGRDDRQQGQVEAYHREHEGLRVMTPPGNRQHDHHDGGTGDQQR